MLNCIFIPNKTQLAFPLVLPALAYVKLPLSSVRSLVSPQLPLLHTFQHCSDGAQQGVCATWLMSTNKAQTEPYLVSSHEWCQKLNK